MEETKRNDEVRNSSPSEATGDGYGMQGIDKAPGEEPSKDNVQFKQESQKGKQPVDADPSKEANAPDEQDLR